MSEMMKFPILYKKTNAGSGAIQQWSIWTDGATICTMYGQVGGKLQTTTDLVKEGKNIGKRNETTPIQQAQIECEAKWQKQKKKRYVENMADAAKGEIDKESVLGGIQPMLAPSKIWPIFRNKIKFPVWCQPKLDGMRAIGMLDDGVGSLWSRTQKPILSVPHIVEEIEDMFGPLGDIYTIPDGEAYSVEYHDQFEELLSILRKDEPSEKSTLVDYHIYDLPSCPGPFSVRHEALSKILSKKIGHLVPVRTVICYNDDDIEACHEQNLAENYEGTMIRGDGPYERGKRSYFLQKYKNFSDAEYTILDAEEGRGKDAGTVGAFVCSTKDGKTFNCRLKATYERRRELFNNPKQWKEMLLTVKYQNLTSDGIPRFPIGKALRKGNE